MKKWRFALPLLGLIWFQLAFAQTPIIIRFSHVVASDTPKGLAAQFFAAKAAEYTSKRVRVEVYPNSTLYNDTEEMTALQQGHVQMLAPSLAKFGKLDLPEFELFDLPYLFDSYTSVHKITEGPIGKALLKKLETKGLTGLAYWDNGFRSFSANTPIRSPADLRNKRIRIQNSQVLSAQIRRLDAIPVNLIFSDVYQALATGRIDGTENPPSNMLTQKIFDVQKHYTLTEHGFLGYAVIVNQQFWDALPEDIRSQLNRAMKDSTIYANRVAERANAQDLVRISKSRKTEVYKPSSEEINAFKRALLPIHKEMRARIGPALLDAVYAEIGKPTTPN
jgi:C4-dicarboxylate-binding protein DctP